MAPFANTWDSDYVILEATDINASPVPLQAQSSVGDYPTSENGTNYPMRHATDPTHDINPPFLVRSHAQQTWVHGSLLSMCVVDGDRGSTKNSTCGVQQLRSAFDEKVTALFGEGGLKGRTRLRFPRKSENGAKLHDTSGAMAHVSTKYYGALAVRVIITTRVQQYSHPIATQAL